MSTNKRESYIALERGISLLKALLQLCQKEFPQEPQEPRQLSNQQKSSCRNQETLNVYRRRDNNGPYLHVLASQRLMAKALQKIRGRQDPLGSNEIYDEAGTHKSSKEKAVAAVKILHERLIASGINEELFKEATGKDFKEPNQTAAYWELIIPLWDDATDDQILHRLSYSSSQDKPAHFQELSTLIQDKINGFVGRKYIFTDIDNFIEKNTKGYFLITGDAGAGKTTLLAKYAALQMEKAENECIIYFNNTGGYYTTKNFLDTICTQLANCYQLSFLPPTDPQEYRTLLYNRLSEVYYRSNRRVIIMVDALDEIDPQERISSENILSLPRENLPERIYFILTSRRDAINLSVKPPIEIERCDLEEKYKHQSHQDIRDYIINRIRESESLRQQIRRWVGDNTTEFVELLAQKSDTNFMVVYYLLHDIENSKYQDFNLEELPNNLKEYYKIHWQRMGMNDISKENITEDIRLLVLAHISESPHPVSCDSIAQWTDKSIVEVQDILNKWEQFFKIDKNENPNVYSIYHKSFWDFLHEDALLEATRKFVHQQRAFKDLEQYKGLF